MPTQNILATPDTTSQLEALNKQTGSRILALVYNTGSKILKAKDIVNGIIADLFGGASDLQFPSATGGVKLAVDLMQRVTVTVTSAQIKTLNSVPTTILAAPGAGFGLVINTIVFNMVFGTTQYASGGAVSVTYTGNATNLLATTLAANQITSATSTRNWIPAAAGQNAILVNTGLDIKAATGDFTTGDGVLNVTIEYKIVPLS